MLSTKKSFMPTRCSDQLELQRNFKQSSFIILSSFFALPGTVGLTLSRMCYGQQQPCLCCSKPMLSVHFCFKVVESEKFHQQQLRNNKENGLPATTLFVSAQKECFFYLLPGGNFPISVLPILKKGNLFLATLEAGQKLNWWWNHQQISRSQWVTCVVTRPFPRVSTVSWNYSTATGSIGNIELKLRSRQET